MRYVSLHTHSTYSYMDGLGLPEEHVLRVKELGMTSLALTEHGNVSSHVKLEIAAQKNGIKPIFGLEAYTAPHDMRETQNQRKWHLTLLAATPLGYTNLMQLVTESWDEGFYRWPTVLSPSLRRHGRGIIALSGCADSHLACTLLGGKGIPEPKNAQERREYRQRAEALLKTYQRLFPDGYYLECQRFPGLERSCVLNRQYATWSEEFGIPLVATSDVHYPQPDQNELQKILHAAGRNTGTVAAAEAEWEYSILLTYPQSDAEIRADLRATGLTARQASNAVEQTANIAERCNVTLPKMDRIRYPVSEDDFDPVKAGFA